jgi:trehalose 6-phosphate phosphatase
MRAILDAVPPAATLAEALRPLCEDPSHSAILLDVDGTLAPIVRHASDARVDEPTRALLIEIAHRYGTVACVSGRPAAVAREIVAIDSIAYVGNHGCERLAPGATQVELDPEVAPWIERIRAFAATAETPELGRLGVRFEDKGPIAAFHWRGAPDEDAALAALREVEAEARARGFDIHWGRKVLEVRPPLPIDKGRGVEGLLAAPVGRAASGEEIARGLYMGDDVTDIDAFRGLRAALHGGALCVGVGSDETPPELDQAADLMVDGAAGVREVLQGLLR